MFLSWKGSCIFSGRPSTFGQSLLIGSFCKNTSVRVIITHTSTADPIMGNPHIVATILVLTWLQLLFRRIVRPLNDAEAPWLFLQRRK